MNDSTNDTNSPNDSGSSNDAESLDGTLQRLSALAASRRNFLFGAGGLAAVGVLAACSSDKKSAKTKTNSSDTGSASSGATTGASSDTSSASGETTTSSGGGGGGGDLTVAAFAASLEVLAVNTYKAAGDAATANKLGPVPPAVGTFVTTAMSQHQAALEKWNSVLTGAGKPAVDKPDAKLSSTVNDAFGKVTDIPGAAKLALMLEQIAAATYQKAIPSLKSKDAIQLAGSIQIIDFQHAAVLLFALGKYPVPDTFGKTDMAASPS